MRASPRARKTTRGLGFKAPKTCPGLMAGTAAPVWSGALTGAGVLGEVLGERLVAGVLAPAAGGGIAEACCCSAVTVARGTVSAAGDGTAVCGGATTG